MSVFVLTVLQFIFIQNLVCVSGNTNINNLKEDAILNTTGLATKYGHPPTQYDVITEDGYILSLFRLPGRSSIPILLSHGLLDSSDTWLLRGRKSLAITLADNGYDIWLANSRGNRYSRRHQYLDPDADSAFWDFSFHEMGCYDLPAIIDKILQETSAKNVTTIGHSQGNTMYYVLGSERKEYNSKINVLIALAPVAFLHNSPPLKLNIIKQYYLQTTDGRREIFGDNTLSGQLVHRLCSIPGVGYLICQYGVSIPLQGWDPDELESEFYAMGAMHSPAGASVLCSLHYLQVAYSEKFAQYDYGRKINLMIYNSSEPPEYHLDQVTMPIALLAARNDPLSSLVDVAILKERLANVVYYFINPRKKMNHIDYVWGRTMHVYLFPYIYRVLYENNYYNPA